MNLLSGCNPSPGTGIIPIAGRIERREDLPPSVSHLTKFAADARLFSPFSMEELRSCAGRLLASAEIKLAGIGIAWGGAALLATFLAIGIASGVLSRRR